MIFLPVDKIQVGLRLEETPLKKVRIIAKNEKRSVNAYIEILIENAIREYENTNGVIVVPDEI